MYNTFQYNTKLYNTNLPQEAVDLIDDIIINNLSLQSDNIITQNILYDSAPVRDFPTQAVPRDHGGIILGDYWRQKTVTLRGILKYDTNELLECAIDTFKRIVTEQESILKLNIACTQREFVVTAINTDRMFARRQGYHITICPFNLDLLCLTPFALSPDYVSQTITDTSVLELNEQFFNEGTAPSAPILILVFTTATNVSSVKFSNNTTNESIELTTPLSDGDYVRFDGESKEVTVNGIQADYDGAFPSLLAGSNFYTIDITGDSVQYTSTLKHKIPYL